MVGRNRNQTAGMTPLHDGHVFYIPASAITDGVAVLEDKHERRHLVRVLRKRSGDEINWVDGEGWIYTGRIESIDPEAVRIRLISRLRDETEPFVRLTLAPALIKGNRLDAVIEKATEIGVAEIIPMHTARTIAGHSASRCARWQRIALSAMKQSLRSRLPHIAPVTDFHALLAQAGTYNLALIAWEDERNNRIEAMLAEQPQPERVLLMIGPEGGFDAEEITAATHAGVHPISFGRRRFRADTACIIGVTAVMTGLDAL